MDKYAIAQAIVAQGYSPRFTHLTRHSCRAPKGSVKRYVYAVHNGCTPRYLGKFEEVAQMDEDALRLRLASKFAQPAQGGQ